MTSKNGNIARQATSALKVKELILERVFLAKIVTERPPSQTREEEENRSRQAEEDYASFTRRYGHTFLGFPGGVPVFNVFHAFAHDPSKAPAFINENVGASFLAAERLDAGEYKQAVSQCFISE